MRPSRPAVAIALLAAALATAGCGIGAGEGVGEVSLTVTRDYGGERLFGPEREEARESDTVMRLLERNAEISTRYGGEFVSSVDGLAQARAGGGSFDWLYYVNGVEASVGAAQYALHGGDAVWWDYRDWSAAQSVPAVVGSWPQPFRDGYDGKRRPVAVECPDRGAACREVRSRLAGSSVALAGRPGGPASNEQSAEGSGSGGVDGGAIRVLVGPWAAVREDPAVRQIERGPQASGVFADFEHGGAGEDMLVGLDENGGEARRFGRAAGLVAATRRYGAPPVWVVTGPTQVGVCAAAHLLNAADLRDHYAVAVEGDAETPLPVGAGAG